MINMSDQKVNPDWPFSDDLSCPECGENYHLMASNLEKENGELQRAKIQCGIGLVDGEPTGCGNIWDWEQRE